MAIASTVVFTASSHWATTMDGSAGTTVKTTSSGQPISRGRSNQRRPRSQLATIQAMIAAAMTNAAAARFSAGLQCSRSSALRPRIT